MKEFEKWFPFSKSNDYQKAVLIFCFHHAGGSAAAYRKWTERNNEKVAFIPVELPGKGCRMNEQYNYDMDSVSALAAEAISEFAGHRKYILYGHSMGSAIAFKTAYEIEQKYENNPLALIVSGRHSPCVHLSDRYSTDMDDSELIKELKRMGGTPKEILENRAVLEMLLPFVKNDYKLNESFSYNGNKINIPIITYSGSMDKDATIDMAGEWQNVTTKKIEKHECYGNHFFIFDLGDLYIDIIIKKVASIAQNRKNVIKYRRKNEEEIFTFI